MKNLIIFYSRRGQNYSDGGIKNLERGNTEIVAEFIKDAIGGTLFEIETEKQYSLDYYKCTEEAKEELKTNARPKLKNYIKTIDEYNNIFICGPCWWGTFPMAMFTQLETLDWDGKNIFAVVTHGGSGFGNCERDLIKTCKGAKLGKGLAIFGSQASNSKDEVFNWAQNVVKSLL